MINTIRAKEIRGTFVLSVSWVHCKTIVGGGGPLGKTIVGVGVPFTHEPIYVSKRAHLDGPITPVVMDSSTELGSFLMMTSDWGLSQSSVIFFIAVVGYVK